MKTKKLIKILRNDPQFVDPEIMAEAANRLELLSVELKKTHAKLAAARDELHRLSVCSTCTGNGTKCHVDMPVPENPTYCGGYEWRGATDTNVGGKKEEG